MGVVPGLPPVAAAMPGAGDRAGGFDGQRNLPVWWDARHHRRHRQRPRVDRVQDEPQALSRPPGRIAAAVAGRAFGYARQARLTMWALTLPQVAATLAAALVGYDTLNAAGERLVADEIFNTVLVLLVVTSLLGPVLTELFTPRMVRQEARTTPASA